MMRFTQMLLLQVPVKFTLTEIAQAITVVCMLHTHMVSHLKLPAPRVQQSSRFLAQISSVHFRQHQKLVLSQPSPSDFFELSNPEFAEFFFRLVQDQLLL